MDAEEPKKREPGKRWAPQPKDLVPGADLSYADLESASLPGIKLAGASLEFANLRNADLTEADLTDAELWQANLSGANLDLAKLSNASLANAKLERSSLVQANLRGADLQEANLTGANVAAYLDEKTVLTETILCDADLTKVNEFRVLPGLTFVFKGLFTLDGNDIRGTRFRPDSPDHWSILRRHYTGFMAVMHLGLALLALAPFVVKALSGLTDDGPMPISILTGWVERHPMIFMGNMIIITYNLLRLVLTRSLSLLREDETRSNLAPSKDSYWIYWQCHKWFLAWMEGLATYLGLRQSVRWLFQME